MSAERVIQLIEAGLWLRMSGDLEGARRLFEQALRLEPGNAHARELLGPRKEGTVELPVEFRAPSKLPEQAQIVNFHKPERALPATTPPAGPRETVRPSPAPSVAPLQPKLAPPPRKSATPLPTMPAVAPMTSARSSAPTPPPPSGRRSPARPSTPSPLPPPPPRPTEVPAPPVEPELDVEVEMEAEDGWHWGNEPALVIQPVHGVGRDALDVLSDPRPAPFLQPSGPGVSGATAAHEVRALVKGAKDLIGLDDHSGALLLCQKALALDARNPDALRLREQSERTLSAMYESKLGNLDARPRVLLREDEVIWLNLDHRAGFVLAQIDGTMSYEDLFLVSGMSRVDTLRILAELKDENVVG